MDRALGRGARPKKSLGQHFLKDPATAGRIVDALAPLTDDWVVEIGPGRGALTERLAEKVGPGGRLILLETDRALAAALGENFGGRAEIDVREADARRVGYGPLLSGAPRGALAIGNLPYNAAAPILFNLLAQRSIFSRWVVMLQREVAERLVAPPRSKARGLLSAIFGMYADVEIVMRLKPGAFRPPPKVDSAVVRLDILPGPRCDLGDEALFEKIVRSSFAGRRKILRNSLARSTALPFGEAETLRALAAAGVDPSRRAEELTLEEWAAVSRELAGR